MLKNLPLSILCIFNYCWIIVIPYPNHFEVLEIYRICIEFRSPCSNTFVPPAEVDGMLEPA